MPGGSVTKIGRKYKKWTFYKLFISLYCRTHKPKVYPKMYLKFIQVVT
jgi:hypothetical protein